MKKIVVLKHQNEMKFTSEFFRMEIPQELSFLIYLICIICITFLYIICFGQVDDVIKTRGSIRTKENVSSVRNIISGPIVQLNYKPGEKVEKDDILFQIDAADADFQMNIVKFDIFDLEFKLNGLYDLKNSFCQNRNLCNPQNEMAFSRFNSYLQNKKILEIKSQIAEEEYSTEIKKHDSIRIPYETEKKLKNYKLAIADLQSFESEFIASINSEINEKQILLYQNQQTLLKLENQYSFYEVRAPMSGYIQEIASLNVGDYLEANSKVLNIVPNDNENFRVEIQIAPRDMGKIAVGKTVKYRLSAFPFFEYKGAEGCITSIDPDIRLSQDGKNAYFSVYANIDRINFTNRHGESFPIRAGLETDVQIVLDRKPIIYFLLKRLDFLT